jgi:uncharacterized membrane-anchored protein
MSNLTNDLTKLGPAYLAMAELGYRPAAREGDPDTVSCDEVEAYARRFVGEEREGSYHVGTANFQTLGVLPFLIEAARLLCRGSSCNDMALKVARLAVADLEALCAPGGESTRRDF